MVSLAPRMAALLSAPLLAVLLSCAPLLCFPATILLEVYAGKSATTHRCTADKREADATIHVFSARELISKGQAMALLSLS